MKRIYIIINLDNIATNFNASTSFPGRRFYDVLPSVEMDMNKKLFLKNGI